MKALLITCLMLLTLVFTAFAGDYPVEEPPPTRDDCVFEEDGLVANPDGTFTFRQTTDESDVPPLWEGPFPLSPSNCSDSAGFEIFTGYDGSYGWKHYWADWNTPNITIQSVQVLICAWDVDEHTCNIEHPGHPEECELDNVFMDGALQNPEHLFGDNNIWSLTTFDVNPATLLDDGYLDMFLEIDVWNEHCEWGTTLSWSQLVVTYSIGGTPNYTIRVDCQGFSGLGNTCNAGSDCDTRDSEDEIWEIEILEDAEYTFSLCAMPGWDSYIFLDEEICGETHLAYNDDACDLTYDVSQIECVELMAGTIVFLLVEGYDYVDCGEYQLDITCCELEYDLGDFNAACDFVSLPWQSLNHPPMVPGNPAHAISDIAWLGQTISGELWADPAGHDNNVPYESTIPGDMTDDGVTFYPPLDICQWEVVDVFVSTGLNWPIYADTAYGALYLSAWKDGNMDADFDDELCGATWPPSGTSPADPGSEWIIHDVPVVPGWNRQIPFFDPGIFDLVPYEPVIRFRLFGEPRGRYGYSLADRVHCNELLGTWQVEQLGEVEDYNISEFYQLPVELTTLEAIAGDRQVMLSWTTATEQNNAYFSILRNDMEIAQVDGSGNSPTAINYEYTDRAVVNGVTYTYQLVSFDINGTRHEYDMTAEATPEAPMPREYALDQNFPNPFNPNTSISYSLMEAGFVTLKVYNIMGQEVANLVSQRLEVGSYSVTFNANTLPSGVYIYRLDVNDFSATKKMMLMK